MIPSPIRARQPQRVAWSRERLIRERSLALGMFVDSSTYLSYYSALNSYLNFVCLHNMEIEPTQDTLSFYIVFMSHHIEPRSVRTYLTGICSQLEVYYPQIREIRRSSLVRNTLAGCMCMRSSPVNRKLPLSRDHLLQVINAANLSIYDDLLFVALLLMGFYGLLRLGELCQPDNPLLRNNRKIVKYLSVRIFTTRFEFVLPTQKTDTYFEGNKVVILKTQSSSRPAQVFHTVFAPPKQEIPPAQRALAY